jgi:hypothetical protein
VLTDGQTNNVGWLGQTEAVDGDIVRGLFDVYEREFLKGVWLENFS